LEAKASVDILVSFGCWFFFQHHSFVYVVELIEDLSISYIDVQDETGESALHKAYLAGSHSIVAILREVMVSEEGDNLEPD
jgi:ankyrin repeat protein